MSRRITHHELDHVLARARQEAWSELAILGPDARYLYLIEHSYRLDQAMGPALALKVATLAHLTSLDLLGHRIGNEGARALATLPRLTKLDLAGNQIGDEGARALAALPNLATLSLGDNWIGDEGARALSTLSCLTLLYLDNNRISDRGVSILLDAWLERGPHHDLEYLALDGNQVSSKLIPPEILHTFRARNILAAYRRYRESVTRPLAEAKVLVLGNEAVGKTSLVRYLVDNQPRDPDEQKTEGAVVHERIETRSWSPGQSNITLNVWDFGGQEIMHRTHQFFLTHRSLYLLVLENRREGDRSIEVVDEWLATIVQRGGRSPIIVVINKSDDGRPGLVLDEKALAERYPNIVSFVRTSCNPGPWAAASIQQLRELMVHTLVHDERLKHVRDPVPVSWLAIKRAVSDRARDEYVLEVKHFERLCQEQDITDEHEQRALLGLLHDLGAVVAHGLERHAPAALRQVTLLDPNWLTVAIYTLLNSRRVLDQGGVFARAQLEQLLHPRTYPAVWHEFILSMMMNPDLSLCFRLPDTEGEERYLIPEALPISEPDYDDVFPGDALGFRYRYPRVLPRGLIPRFIVAAHQLLTSKRTTWRTGVRLHVEDCPVLVRGDRSQRVIDIRVAGPSSRRRAALTVVRHHLDHVNSLSPGLEVYAEVPLPDAPGVHVSYDHLLALERLEGLEHSFLPVGGPRKYTVRELLQGVQLDMPRDPALLHYYHHGDVYMSDRYDKSSIRNKVEVLHSPGAQIAVDGGHARARDIVVTQASAEDASVSDQAWQQDIASILHAIVDRMDELEDEVWRTSTALFKRLQALEVDGRPRAEVLAQVTDGLDADERRALEKLHPSLRAVLENLVASALWQGVFAAL